MCRGRLGSRSKPFCQCDVLLAAAFRQRLAYAQSPDVFKQITAYPHLNQQGPNACQTTKKPAN